MVDSKEDILKLYTKNFRFERISKIIKFFGKLDLTFYI